mgnify:CR=1 FL=1|tara:strand:+ start:3143 stop:3715 length:573 start_codon:yes stop_codon:yes gene_type:complete
MRLAPVRTAAPSLEPVTLAEVKTHLRVDHTDEDDYIAALISAAIEQLEGHVGILGGRALVNQSWRQDFGGFAADLRLSLSPLVSVTSVTYYDADNAQQTLAASVYQAFDDALGPYLATAPGESWPSAYGRVDAVSVTFVAGYGATAASVPAPIRAAIMLAVGNWYDERGGALDMPPAAIALVRPYRRRGV